MIMEKLMSKRGQISMEIGILVAAAVAVAAVAAYFYIQSVKSSAQDVGAAADDTITKMKEKTEDIATKIETELDELDKKEKQ
ncbi:MAG TPA: class III signal peptide-containing protein [Methanothermococcus okinawensis]|uniref:Class III signal peptide-containing protein n=1 Tax=Methanothermococcus okinawensis TaxID=155863 RepID=A0A833E485_9EURY|nr:class III signal peptide-containing protein [Methanothermococcus okinawensis]